MSKNGVIISDATPNIKKTQTSVIEMTSNQNNDPHVSKPEKIRSFFILTSSCSRCWNDIIYQNIYNVNILCVAKG
jgi:hypothetical protein